MQQNLTPPTWSWAVKLHNTAWKFDTYRDAVKFARENKAREESIKWQPKQPAK